MLICFPALAGSASNLEAGGFTEPDFFMYGFTDSDLAPIADYLSLLQDNGIFLKLPDLSVTKKEDQDWIYTKIGKSIWLTYQYYLDGSRQALWMEFPMDYKPKDEAHVLLIMSMLSIEKNKAEELYKSLQYNLIDGNSELSTEAYKLTYYEICQGNNGSQTLVVEVYE